MKRQKIGIAKCKTKKIFYLNEEKRVLVARIVNQKFTKKNSHGKEINTQTQVAVNKKISRLLHEPRDIDCLIYWFCYSLVSADNWRGFSCRFCPTYNRRIDKDVINVLRNYCNLYDKHKLKDSCKTESGSFKITLYAPTDATGKNNPGPDRKKAIYKSRLSAKIPSVWRIVAGKIALTIYDAVLNEAIKFAGDYSRKNLSDTKLYKVNRDKSLTEVYFKYLYYFQLEKKNGNSAKAEGFNSGSHYELIVDNRFYYLGKIKVEEARSKARALEKKNPGKITLYKVTIKGRYRMNYLEFESKPKKRGRRRTMCGDGGLNIIQGDEDTNGRKEEETLTQELYEQRPGLATEFLGNTCQSGDNYPQTGR